MFDHICNFKINASGLDLEEIELDLIDFGAEEVFLDGDNVMIYAPFQFLEYYNRNLRKEILKLFHLGLIGFQTLLKKLMKNKERRLKSY